MTIELALSGMSMALFCAVSAVFLVSVAALLAGGVVLALIKSGRLILSLINKAMTEPIKLKPEAVRKPVKEGAR